MPHSSADTLLNKLVKSWTANCTLQDIFFKVDSKLVGHTFWEAWSRREFFGKAETRSNNDQNVLILLKG